MVHIIYIYIYYMCKLGDVEFLSSTTGGRVGPQRKEPKRAGPFKGSCWFPAAPSPSSGLLPRNLVEVKIHFAANFGIILGSFLGPFWDHFGTILGPSWDHLGTILGPFWDYGDIVYNLFSG